MLDAPPNPAQSTLDLSQDAEPVATAAPATGVVPTTGTELAAPVLNGFRLQRLEVYNWGTFDQQVWCLHANGENALLTGDIGSGKSTLVDAITTLLVPAHRIAYNKAAGAQGKERDLRSYVLGYYKTERSEHGGNARPVALRSANHYSVILGVFRHAGLQQSVTLAQVFYLKEAHAQPVRFYLGVEQDWAITRQFSNFGNDINVLRKNLRKAGAELFDSFPPYGAWFRRRFGIENEQALELFHQTVSMKSIGNLTDFVRAHMLQAFDVEPRIKALLEHFDNLQRAHDAVLRAKQKIDLLQPLHEQCQRHLGFIQQSAQLRSQRDVLKAFFAAHKVQLLVQRIQNYDQELRLQGHKLEQMKAQQQQRRVELDDLQQTIAANGGDRLNRLEVEIRRKVEERERRQRKAERYAALCSQVEAGAAQESAGFLLQKQAFQQQLEEVAEKRNTIENRRMGCQSLKQSTDSEAALLQQEIENLQQRTSNIPFEQVRLRQQLCKAIGVAEEELPYAGELIKVNDQQRDWEGAAERLLHNFALSLLVPEAHYAAVAEWVEHSQFKLRLVYFRVRLQGRYAPRAEMLEDALWHKLEIKQSPLAPWLEQELAQKTNLSCCETLDALRRQPFAITRNGQIKINGSRHEKDDRFRIDDRSRYVLGWSSLEKLALFLTQKKQLDQRSASLHKQLLNLENDLRALRVQENALSALAEFTDFEEQDWAALVPEITQLEQEKQDLQKSSNQLRVWQEKLLHLQQEFEQADLRREQAGKDLGKLQNTRDHAGNMQEEYSALCDPEQLAPWQESLQSALQQLLGQSKLSVENCDARERDLREQLQSRLDSEERKIRQVREDITLRMKDFITQFPQESSELDANVEAAHEYERMLQQLLDDDLPRFAQRFKELLNENTIREIANFQSQLARERDQIKDSIQRINLSLRQIDYNSGRYIQLETEASQDLEIRNFQESLRACTDGGLNPEDNEQYSEQKFLQVKLILERFRGRSTSSEADRRWSAKVTDVRNWFVFAASERWLEDDSEHEHYSDSGGKSGGQKEKLAYTILAASLAYQFGLGDDAQARSFHFVVIDEAFGRGSDESAQYGLRLFAKLNLQLLIVTPLQKIHIIEPYVAAVGFVHNSDGRQSQLRNLSISQYQEEKARQQLPALEAAGGNAG